ncbi:hypothetical protein RhiirC2_780885 [Rhizophagus irregularis]|uniref:Uncharacterized protein n=1 Tax=Rhizophagus irregularis TaxID=588596 RepID=A0A2N1N6J1_9GLOM|nr:hypothetical protein RhiirC2_780885 [Rhizophagus irregularis]
MKISIIISKIVFILYFITCVGAEIWHLKTLFDIGDYNDYGVHREIFTMIYTNFFYFIGNLLLIIFTIQYMNDDDESFGIYIASYLYTQFVILMVGCRFVITYSYLGQIPFNCDFDHYLPDNIKIACKARYLSCTLGFSSYILPFIPLLINAENHCLNIKKFLKRANPKNIIMENLCIVADLAKGERRWKEEIFHGLIIKSSSANLEEN